MRKAGLLLVLFVIPALAQAEGSFVPVGVSSGVSHAAEAIVYGESEVTKLNLVDEGRLRSFPWPEGAYRDDWYSEFEFDPSIQDLPALAQVHIELDVLTGRYVKAIKVQSWDGESFVDFDGGELDFDLRQFTRNQRLSVRVPHDHVDTESEVNNYKFRVLGWRQQAGNSVGHRIYYDKVSLNVRPPDPVIIVPGILGSWQKNDEWIIDPVLHTYDNLIDTFKLNGYVEGATIFPFPYDWRNDIRSTAIRLREKIEEIKEICGCDKVDIIAHSMGGLVARSYAQSDKYADDIDQLIFLATPHLGSVRSYLTWEGGIVSENRDFSELILEMTIRDMAEHEGFGDVFDYVREKPVSSVSQLLPTFDYIFDDKTGGKRGQPTNRFLEELNTNLGILYESGIRISNFTGEQTGTTTLKSIRVIDLEFHDGKWSYGYPKDLTSAKNTSLNYDKGDGTVLSESAKFVNSPEVVMSEHREIVEDLQVDLFDKLLGFRPQQISLEDYGLFDIGWGYLRINIFSPVDIQIVAPDGKRLGKDFETGGEFDEIEGAFYSGYLGEHEYAIIPNPVEGEYKTLVQGTGDGEYKIRVTRTIENGLVADEYAGVAASGLTEEISLSTFGGEVELEVVVEESPGEEEVTVAANGPPVNSSLPQVLGKTVSREERALYELKLHLYRVAVEAVRELQLEVDRLLANTYKTK